MNTAPKRCNSKSISARNNPHSKNLTKKSLSIILMLVMFNDRHKQRLCPALYIGFEKDDITKNQCYHFDYFFDI